MELEELKKEIDDFKAACKAYKKELVRLQDPMMPFFVGSSELSNKLRSELNSKYGFLENYIRKLGRNSRNQYGQPAYGTAFANEMGMILRVGPALDAVIQDLDYIKGKIASITEEDFNNMFSTKKQLSEAAMEEKLDKHFSDDKEMTLKKIFLVCQNLHRIAFNLKERQRERAPLLINDEYDVQYLLKGLLNIFFENVGTEEWTPSRSGSSSRMDFILKPERTVIETKITRNGLKIRELKEELTLDIHDYIEHYHCETLIFFIYDPIGIISNQQEFINGIAGEHAIRDKKVYVRVIISPRLDLTSSDEVI